MSALCVKPSTSVASRLRLLLPLALVLLTGVQQSAVAGITQSVPFTGQLVVGGTGTFQINGSLNQFDPSLGPLESVQLSLTDVHITGDVLFEDLATAPEANPQHDILYSMRYNLTFSGIPSPSSNSITYVLDSSPGNPMPSTPLAETFLQFGGTTSANESFSYDITAGPVLTFDSSETPLFEGNGTIPFSLAGMTDVTFKAGSPSRTTIESTDIAGIIDLTYVTAPEVNIGMIAMLSVLSGTCWLLARRKTVRA